MTGASADTVTALGEERPGIVLIEQLVTVYAPGPVEGRARLLAGPVVIGREPGPDGVALPDPEVSRRHARLERVESGWRLTDLGSRNGVLVDGVATREATLDDGAVVRIGSSLLVLVRVELAAAAVLADEADGLLGGSVRMQRLRGEVVAVAPRRLPVLVHGESGVGKELVARAVHRASGRGGPFVAVNCAAIAPTLADSELFGHVAGAFTGATGRRDGLVARADRGTLFLDEIAELPVDVQAKLLRALATGECRPVGATDPTTVDVRIVAATLRPLDAAVAAGAFRGDLYARLAGWTVEVPPLRARRDDILRLASAWLATHAPGATLSPTAAEALLVHAWPYNVRELEHALDVALVRVRAGGVLRLDDLPAGVGAVVRRRVGSSAAAPPLELTISRDGVPSVDDLRRALAHFGGSVVLVAGFFGRDRRQVYRWCERHALDPDAFRSRGGAQDGPRDDGDTPA